MLKHSFYCPFCFHLIEACNLKYRDPKCGRIVARQASFAEKMGIVSSPKSIPCPSANYSENVKKNPEQCRKCSQKISQRICPKCEANLPMAIDDLSDFTIAIIGAKGSGKSHYVALLIERIKQLFRTFDWTLQALTEETIDNYKENFYNPLFLDNVPLQSTRKEAEPEPLMYSLKFGQSGKRILLVFFDAAGEHFNNATTMSSMNRYIYNAAGIICLLDPLQMQAVREEISTTGGDLPDKGCDTGEILERLNSVLRQGFEEKGHALGAKKIPTPLALAFSKIDALKAPGPEYAGRILFDPDSMVYQDSRYQGYVEERELETIHGHMESWLEVADPQQHILQQCQDFKTVKYFGFSALGAPPTDHNSKLGCPPRPYRVEDAFLWLLAINGFVKLK